MVARLVLVVVLVLALVVEIRSPKSQNKLGQFLFSLQRNVMIYLRRVQTLPEYGGYAKLFDKSRSNARFAMPNICCCPNDFQYTTEGGILCNTVHPTFISPVVTSPPKMLSVCFDLSVACPELGP